MLATLGILYVLLYAGLCIVEMRDDIAQDKPLWYLVADSIATLSVVTAFTAWFSPDLERFVGVAVWALLIYFVAWQFYAAPKAFAAIRLKASSHSDTTPENVTAGIRLALVLGIALHLPAVAAAIAVGLRHLPWR